MKTKDLVYVALIGYLAYLLMKKNPNSQLNQCESITGSTPKSGEMPKGGLTLGQNMDLPNLTPTAPNGMSTEVALNTNNVSPLIKDDNEPTQVFGDYNLPPAYGVSTINENPLDVTIPAQTEMPTQTPTQANVLLERLSTPVDTNLTPSLVSGSVVKEPIFEVKITKTISTLEPTLGLSKTKMTEASKEELISECGNSFSIPNNDKEGSYTNYWFDGIDFFTQTTSPLMRTVPTKISKDLFVDGCKKFQVFKTTNS
jgi:hypothetical protein